MKRTRHHHLPAFTLIELLVVISIIALLIGILLPVLGSARFQAKITTCAAQLSQIGVASYAYATDDGGTFPHGPTNAIGAPGASPYPGDFLATNVLYAIDPAAAANSAYVAHGKLYEGQYIKDPDGFFCPDDDTFDPVEEREHLVDRSDNAFSSYMYRQTDQSFLISTPTLGTTPNLTRKLGMNLDGFTFNSNGDEATALAFDLNSLSTSPGLVTRTNHQNQSVNALFRDGHVESFRNADPETDGDYNLPTTMTALTTTVAIDTLLINFDATQ